MKDLGIPDSQVRGGGAPRAAPASSPHHPAPRSPQIILMMGDDVACNPRNTFPGTVVNNVHERANLCGARLRAMALAAQHPRSLPPTRTPPPRAATAKM